MLESAPANNRLDMQLLLIPVLAQAWHIPFSALSDIFRQYHVLEYISSAYDMFNSMGNQGIVDDIEEFIAVQGGSVK